jgi:hypothetical protein
MAGYELSKDGFLPFNGIKKMIKLSSRTFWIIILVMFMLFFVSTVTLAHSVEATDPKTEEITLSVRPIAVIDYSLGPGSEFDVNVTLNMTASNATGLHGFALELAYDANLVECETVREGDLLRNYGNTSWSTTSWNVTTADGAGDVYSSVNLTSLEGVAEGNGTLIGLTYKVLERGETSIHIHNVSLYNNNGALLSYVAIDGYFNNKFLVDVAMPLTLFAVTFAAVLLNRKTEDKLKTTLEEKELGVRDTVLLVGLMVIMISSIVLFRGLVAPLMILFMFSYSMLLFIFTYLFSRQRWYVAIMSPVMFILLYVFLRNSFVWTDYLVSIYGVVFAVLITLYVGSLFSWKPTLIFAGLLTTADIILVLVTGTMVQAANTTFISLSLPVMVAVPVVPPIATSLGFLPMALGIGDFFFAGLLATQTFKKYGKTMMIISIISMTVSFFLFEMFLLTFWKIGFPGTLMIICGWLPPVAVKMMKDRYRKVRKE